MENQSLLEKIFIGYSEIVFFANPGKANDRQTDSWQSKLPKDQLWLVRGIKMGTLIG